MCVVLGGVAEAAGPVWPVPKGLWKPGKGETPGKGNFVYLDSQSGDYIGAGRNYTYTPLNSMLVFSETSGVLTVGVTGDEGWLAYFSVMQPLTTLKPGYYGDLQDSVYNYTEGGLYWYGQDRSCDNVKGWFAVDQVEYQNDAVTFIRMRFEQHCEGKNPALRGAVQYTVTDKRHPKGPSMPPKDLWTPPKNVISQGNMVYLESQPGDKVGGGKTYSYNASNAQIYVTNGQNAFTILLGGEKQWTGSFQGMNVIQQLQKGYYPHVQRYLFNNPTMGGLSWYGDGLGCDTLWGWFVVDGVTYNATGMTAVKLRFAQYCEGSSSALFGAVYWAADNPVNPPGPVNPPPSSLWRPDPSALPASGDFVYLESDSDDIVGHGENLTYTPLNSTILCGASGVFLNVKVACSDYSRLNGDFLGMNSLTQLEPGYYGGLQLYPYNNPLVGGLSWNGGLCDTVIGWFAVDSIQYSNGKFASVSLRFGQHCNGTPAALHGAIRCRGNNNLF